MNGPTAPTQVTALWRSVMISRPAQEPPEIVRPRWGPPGTNGGVLVALRQLVSGTLAGTLVQVTGSVAGSHGVAGTAAGTVGGGAGGVFGNNQTSSNSDNSPNQYAVMDRAVQTFACPGTGPQTLQCLEIYGWSAGGTPSNIRLAIYKASDLSLVAQWTAENSINSTTPQWWGGSQGLSATTVQGGTQYVFALTGDGSDARWAFTSGSMFYGGADYTGGFPSTFD